MFKLFQKSPEAVEFSDLQTGAKYGALADAPAAPKVPLKKAAAVNRPSLFGNPELPEVKKEPIPQPNTKIKDQSRLTRNEKKIAQQAAQAYLSLYDANPYPQDPTSNEAHTILLMEAIAKGATLNELGGIGGNWNFFNILRASPIQHINLQFLRANEQLWHLESEIENLPYKNVKPLAELLNSNKAGKANEAMEKLVCLLLDCTHQGGDIKIWLEDRNKEHRASLIPSISRLGINLIMDRLQTQIKWEQEAQAKALRLP
jgi:hypothetical protein